MGPQTDSDARKHAIDPTRNVVLQASAGTGKTWVLVERYHKLLQADVDPANILCLTFTRQAAAEMRTRVIDKLRTDESVDGKQRWLKLRDRLGDFNIDTIDAFCHALLREFPLEAGLEPGFRIADETEIHRFTEEALDRVMHMAPRIAQRDSDVALTLAEMTAPQMRKSLSKELKRRVESDKAQGLFVTKDRATAQQVEEDTRRALQGFLKNLPDGVERFVENGPVGHPRFAMLTKDLLRLQDSDLWTGAQLRSLLERLEEHFLTQKGTPRKRLWNGYSAGTFPLEEDRKSHQEMVEASAKNLPRISKDFRAGLNAAQARGFRRLFSMTEKEYCQALERNATLDFPELQARALKLLSQMDEFARSRYRLEARYHHVLIDEVQDISQAQWELVKLLTQSWAEGLGVAGDAPLEPSIFVVGDRKQSIYKFRNANAQVFNDVVRHISQLRAEQDVTMSIKKSFRSEQTLLNFINHLCDEIESEKERSDAFKYESEDQFLNVATSNDHQPRLGLAIADEEETCAVAVAQEIQRLLDNGTVKDPNSHMLRSVQPADVAILFRSRTSHREFERALADRGIPAAVYKGLGFFEADESKDLLALIRFLADPASDLRAAAFMRSGFVRLSDAALQSLAPHLASALIAAVIPEQVSKLDDHDRRILEQIRSAVATWLKFVDRVPAADLIDRILQESAYVYEVPKTRGTQALENIKKMRSMVRRIQNRGYATLARIADHLDTLSMDDESNAIVEALDSVQLMTIHAAKGLEFPIVFLVSLARGAGGRHDSKVRVVTGQSDRTPSVSVGEYKTLEDEDETVSNKEETKRLLYVATTRARDYLYFSSTLFKGAVKGNSGSIAEVLPKRFLSVWEKAAQAPATEDTVQWTVDGKGAHSFRLCRASDTVTPSRDSDSDRTVASRVNDFATLSPRVRLPHVAASVVGSVESPNRALTEESSTAGKSSRLLGTLVHRLLALQQRPEVTQPEEIGRRLREIAQTTESVALDENDHALSDAVTLYQSIAGQDEVVQLLQQPCIHEVPFSFFLPGETPRVMRGTVDCLVREDETCVAVVEFKTGKPRDEDRVQLEAYLQAARMFFPDLQVRGRLIYAGKSASEK